MAITKSHNDATHLTNFDKHLRPIYEQAIGESGWGGRLWITNCAEWPQMLSLHTNARQTEHGPFWKVFCTLLAKKAIQLGYTFPGDFELGQTLSFDARRWLDAKLKEAEGQA